MAFFKFRPGAQAGPEESASGADTQSIDHLRRRARQRLLGATVLVVLAVIGFPLVFDTQPRPVAVDLAIDIPSKTKVAPSTPPAPLAARAGLPPTTPPTAPLSDPDGKHGLTDQEELVSTLSTEADSAKVSSKEPAKESAKNEPVPSKVQPPATSSTGAGAVALENKDKSAAAEHRYVVQVGAFQDEAKVRETRSKLEKAGLKTYTQVVENKDGKHIRVRLGPFSTKAEADGVADKAKSMQLTTIILTL